MEHGCDYAPVAGKQLYKQKCLELLKGALDIRNRRTTKGIRSKQVVKQTTIRKKQFLELYTFCFQ
ncbi:hypothetical protein DWY37_14180 [Roseburia sp. AF25-13LB]|nr:hypothetical protein DWY43_13310 [Roseburia sp. AF25-18LB]RHQ40806.1 hypothetical protein DWY49_08095 [Roseburia sp. AF25-25LB]RHQ45977.1 hypothetical protein DWY37_14180 [Roseburia sp. AF25-13LB]RHQ46061.1 hypothetical protein DWY39_13435 [Roseburia sp. AF25-15LB]